MAKPLPAAEHHPPHRDGYYEDEHEIRFVVCVRKREGHRLGPQDRSKSPGAPTDAGKLRGALRQAAMGDGPHERGAPFDPTYQIDMTFAGHPEYLPPEWRGRGPSARKDPS